MMNRRNVLLGAAVTALMMTAPALAADELKLPRQQVDLVAPPFVHEHEQATKQGPEDHAVQAGDRREEDGHRQ